MGESNAYGMSATSPGNEWVQVLGQCIRECQDEPVRVFNNAIPANVISPDAPGYVAGDQYRTSPSALERFEQDMIAYRPDLAVYAYGLNDSRCGHDLDSFMRAYETIVAKTREQLPEALLVLVGPYWNLQYDLEAWQRIDRTGWFGRFNRAGDDLVLAYNAAIGALAERTEAIFVDVYHVLAGVDWLLTADACHFNDLGQRLIGLTVFCQLATRCSFVARKSSRMERELDGGIWNTGGTGALPHVIETWRQVDTWQK
jgi:lysophospholipase L1-like esterase